MGLTFLGHTAPALILGVILVLQFTRAMWQHWAEAVVIRPALARLAVAIGVAFLVSLPLSSSILFRYKLDIHNPAPTEYIWGPLALQNFWASVAEASVPILALACVGLAALW